MKCNRDHNLEGEKGLAQVGKWLVEQGFVTVKLENCQGDGICCTQEYLWDVVEWKG